MRNTIMRGMLRTDIGQFCDALNAGRDPVLLMRGEVRLHTTLTGVAEFDWASEVIDFGGHRYIPWEPYSPFPLGTIAMLCHVTIYEEG